MSRVTKLTMAVSILATAWGCAMPLGEGEDDVGVTSEELSGGSPDVQSSLWDSVAWVGGCTGSLVAPDIVLTAGHCFARPYQGQGTTPTFNSMTIAADTIYVHSNLGTGGARISSRSLKGYDLPSSYVGTVPTTVVSMTSQGGALWANTTSNRLLRRDPATGVWQDVGHANGVVALAASDTQLFAVTSGGYIYRRAPNPYDTSWYWFARAPTNIRAMAAGPNRQIYAATTANRLILYPDTALSNQSWEDVGHANGIMSMGSDGDSLVGRSSSNTLWLRDAVPYDQDWRRISSAVSGGDDIAVMGPDLFVKTTGGWLYQREVIAVWTDIETIGPTTAIGSTSSTLYSVTTTDQLRSRPRLGGSWTTIGSAPSSTRFFDADAESSALYAIDASNVVWSRPASSGSWSRVTTVPSGVVVAGLAASSGSIYVTTTAASTTWPNRVIRYTTSWNDRGHANNTQSLAYDGGDLYTVVPSAVAGVRDTVLSRSASVFDQSWTGMAPYEEGGNGTTWYDLANAIAVRFGPNSSSPILTRTARQYASPSNADVLLLRLQTAAGAADPVPASIATPIALVTDAPPTAYWYRLAGYGGVTTRQYAWASDFTELTGDDAGKFRVTLLGSASIVGGDSGGPARQYTSGAGRYAQVGVVQQSGTTPTYAATFASSFTKSNGSVHPNTGEWLEAMVP